MPDTAMPLDKIPVVAERFKALSDPTRLRLLNALRDGERSVTELVSATQLLQNNVSKHLHVLYAGGLVARRRHGAFVYYRIRDARLFRLCDLMCDQVRVEWDDQAVGATAAPRWTVRTLRG